ncbi:MAG: DNA polymerase III subunit alpha, partial [Planctomycetota bacterium]
MTRRQPCTPVPLHLRSRYSLLSGTAASQELVARVARYGYPAFAITDCNNLYGAVNAWRAAQAAGVQAIIGAEVDDGAQHADESSSRGSQEHRSRRSAVLLARNTAGYMRLCRAITRRKLAEPAGEGDAAPHFDLLETLAEDPQGLLILVDDPQLAAQLVERLGTRRARDGVFLELSRPARSITQERNLLHAAESLGLRLVAAGVTPFLSRTDASLHRLLTAMRLLDTVSHVAEAELIAAERQLLPPRPWRDLYADVPAALDNAAAIPRECSYTFQPGRHVFPRFPLPRGETPYSALYQRCYQGLRRRWANISPEAVERLARELKVIREMGFLEYFLIVGDIVAHARERGIENIGRGSGAGSIVAYALGITQVDPLRHQLYFERFLHPSRNDLPDIDIDLCWIGRDEVIDYVYERYGRDRVAMISTHCTFQPRSAFREVARAHGLAPSLVDRISRRIPHRSEQPLPELLAGETILDGIPMARERVTRILHDAERIRSFPHHLSIHPGGMVIADRPLEHYVPLERAAKGVVVTQLDMYSIEDVGLVKIDLLGNRCLSEIRETLDLIEAEYGERPDLDGIPEDDARTGRLLASGRTLGCFQLESPAMRSLLTRLRARDVKSTINAVALVRPGPSQGGMKDRFIACSRGQQAPLYLHP